MNAATNGMRMTGSGIDGLSPDRLATRPGSKWQRRAPDVLPAWIAEMDFPVAEEISAALSDVVTTGAFGYPDWLRGTPLRTLFAERMQRCFGWRISPERVREFSTVTQGVHVAVELATRRGDAVALHTPVFGPLRDGLVSAGRRPVTMPLRDEAEGWTLDLDEFERRVIEHECRALILVNPHNPTGRVLTGRELRALAEIADRHGLWVISDEIHGELVYSPHTHVPFATVAGPVADRTVTITSTSKAFNLSGTRCAVAHFGSPALLAEFDAAPVEFFGAVNVFGMAASCAAWRHGDLWLKSTVDYLDDNRRLLDALLAEHLPQVRCHPAQGTFLAWLDCRALGWGDEPAEHLRERGGVLTSPGTSFGAEGRGYLRLNFATSRDILDEMVRRFVRCVREEGAPC